MLIEGLITKSLELCHKCLQVFHSKFMFQRNARLVYNATQFWGEKDSSTDFKTTDSHHMSSGPF